MSTANFITQDNFPLFARDFYIEDAKRCTECGCVFGNDEDKCECCGGDLEDIGYFFDDIECDVVCHEIQQEMDDLNEGYIFHRLVLKSGYYSGVQLFVDEIHNLDEYEYDNDECHYYFDMCRSAAYRKYHAEQRKVERDMKKLAREYGFDRLAIAARFSNGETWYTRVCKAC